MAYFSPVFVFQKMTQWSTLSGFRNAYTTVFRKYPHWGGGGGEEEKKGGRRGEREGGKKVEEGRVEGEERRVEEEERGEETDTCQVISPKDALYNRLFAEIIFCKQPLPVLK